ncbi:uncharacterized protein LOC131650234 [Vicia villosa]|uniref:uncharacterized protein LOC131650234 n=1 Tax=Vicia villosa TaxID=3911 RepID=UPI00273AEF33|nr:uncharacterized protein LOC131650234 [Vicia villosa]
MASKYGKEFVSAAVELRPDCGVNRLLVEKFSAKAPDGPTNQDKNITGTSQADCAVLIIDFTTGGFEADNNDHMRDDEIDEDWKTFLVTYTGDDDDEMDEDYRFFLATYNSEIETDCASNHSGGSNIGSDETDEEYRSFLATYDPDVENDSAGNQSGGSNIGNDETDAEYISFLATCDPNVENDSAGNQSGGSNIGNDEIDAEYISFLADPAVENDSVGNRSGGSNVDVNLGNNNVKKEIEEGYNCFSNQFVPDYISNRVHVDEDDRLLRKSFSVGKSTLLSNQEFDTPKMQRVVDEDYKQILNSGRVVGGDFVYGSFMNANDTSNVKDERNSSDSDLIVLESCPYCENTPFKSSKAYDSSCFGEEMHPKDNKQMTCIYHSQFRKRLVEYLDRPYDYEEYKSLLAKANERRQKERHLETRQGVIESYHCGGVTKSHLDSHPDVAKAIAMESKENRILFLLRGFFFWIQILYRFFLDTSITISFYDTTRLVDMEHLTAHHQRLLVEFCR